ncbi:MAG: hypothetical protein SGBAC_002591 [Bacillariaceae sp.]
MNELKEEIKKNFTAAQTTTNKFVEAPLWESQAWFLRTRLTLGNDYQQFWDQSQGQINEYVTNLNSEDQQKARAEVAESFTVAIKSGFDDCNKQMDMLLQHVFQGKQLEDESNCEREEPDIIDLLDVEDESVNHRKALDPPSKDEVEKEDPEPSQENNTVNSSIVAIIEEVSEEEHVREDVASEIFDDVDKVVDDDPISDPRNDRLEVALPHRNVEPETTTVHVVEESPAVIGHRSPPKPEITTVREESPEVIDLTNEVEEAAEEVVEIGESLVGQDSREDDEPTPKHSRGLSLSQILLDTYNEETQDTPGRSMWYNRTGTVLDMVLSTIVSRDTEDEGEDEPTIQKAPSKLRDLASVLGLSPPATVDSVTPESNDDVNEGREDANNDSERVDADFSVSAEGSPMEPIDLTQV